MLYTSQKSQLRYALAFTGNSVPTWAAACVESLRNVKGPCDVIWIRVEKSDRHLKPVSAKRVRMTASMLQPLELVDYEGRTKKCIVEQLRDLDLDFILCLEQGEIGEEWKGLAKEGVWSFHFGQDFESGGDFGVREFSSRENIQKVALERSFGPEGSAASLRNGHFKTSLSSMTANRSVILAQCSEWPAQLAQELLVTGRLTLARSPRHKFNRSLSRGARRYSRPVMFLVQPYRKTVEFFKTARRLFTYQQWNIGVVRGPIESLLQSSLQIDWLPAPKWPFSYADPFPIEHKGQRYIVAEQYDFRIDRGSIVVFPMSAIGAQVEAPLTAIHFPFHVSYPCIVKDGSTLYCVAETLETRDIAIYQCEKFPNIWTKVVDVASGHRFADPTLFFHEGRWWIFSTLFDENSGGNATLYAWYADEIRGPWTAHLKNPIKCDVGSSRSAGNPFRVGKFLFRPAQDCSERYGYRVMINKITALSPTAFHEDSVRAITPCASYPDGFHHVASFGDTILVDGRRDFFYPMAAFIKINRRLKQLLVRRKFPFRSASTPATIPSFATTGTKPLRLLRE